MEISIELAWTSVRFLLEAGGLGNESGAWVFQHGTPDANRTALVHSTFDRLGDHLDRKGIFRKSYNPTYSRWPLNEYKVPFERSSSMRRGGRKALEAVVEARHNEFMSWKVWGAGAPTSFPATYGNRCPVAAFWCMVLIVDRHWQAHCLQKIVSLFQKPLTH